MSLLCDDFKVLISFLRMAMFSIYAQRAYLSYFVSVDLSVFAGNAGTDGSFEVSFSHLLLVHWTVMVHRHN